jgi:hypothetical protein
MDIARDSCHTFDTLPTSIISFFRHLEIYASSAMILDRSKPSAFFSSSSPRLPPSCKKRHPAAARRNSSSSFGTWSSDDESCSSFKKDRKCRPTLIGYPATSPGSSSEHWNTFHKRFQSKPKRKKTKNYSMVQSSKKGIFSNLASRMFSDCCTRTRDYREAVVDEWSEYGEVETSQQKRWRLFRKNDDCESESDECRVELTE